MSKFYSKIIHHVNNQENFNLNKKNQLKNTNTQMTLITKLSHKNFKEIIVKMLQ